MLPSTSLHLYLFLWGHLSLSYTSSSSALKWSAISCARAGPGTPGGQLRRCGWRGSQYLSLLVRHEFRLWSVPRTGPPHASLRWSARDRHAPPKDGVLPAPARTTAKPKYAPRQIPEEVSHVEIDMHCYYWINAVERQYVKRSLAQQIWDFKPNITAGPLVGWSAQEHWSRGSLKLDRVVWDFIQVIKCSAKKYIFISLWGGII